MSNHNRLPSIPQLNKSAYAAWLSPYFKNCDYALTMTFRPVRKQYSNYYRPDYNLYAKHIHHYLNKVNRAFLGNEWKAGRRKLNCAYVFELNKSNGVHAHMILETPPIHRFVKNKHAYYLRTMWSEMKYTGDIKGTDFTEVYDATGWLNYMFKDISRTDIVSTSYNADDWHLHES